MFKSFSFIMICIFATGCAGWSRKCSSCTAGSFGANWLIAQYQYNGEPLRCWRLENVSVANEDGSDGIYWENTQGNLVHISGWYNRVQVAGYNNWEHAAQDLRVDLAACISN